jgi:hypothetical protein
MVLGCENTVGAVLVERGRASGFLSPRLVSMAKSCYSFPGPYSYLSKESQEENPGLPKVLFFPRSGLTLRYEGAGGLTKVDYISRVP